MTETYQIEIHAYCLMSNHYHLLIHTPQANLHRAMQQINSRYTRYFNRTTKIDGSLFRGRYKSILVCAEEYLLRLSRYIHRNPLDAKMVVTLEDYPWSSYPAYINHSVAQPWLEQHEIKKRFDQYDFSGDYACFVHQKIKLALGDFYKKKSQDGVLGSVEDKNKIFDELRSRSLLCSEISNVKQMKKRPDASEIITVIAAAYDIESHQITNSTPGRRNILRNVAIILCRNLAGMKISEIANIMGNVNYKAISNSLRKNKNNLAVKKVLGEIISQLDKNER